MSENTISPEESVRLAKQLLRTDPSLGSKIYGKKFDPGGTLDPMDLAKMLETNPLAHALYMKNKEKEKRTTDDDQNRTISALAKQNASQEKRIKKLETWLTWIRGAAAVLIFLWTAVSWILPMVWSSGKAKSAICAQVLECKGKAKKK